MTGFVKAVEQQMKIDKPAKGPPSAENLIDSLIIQRSTEVQPPSKILTGAHIIPGKHVSPTEPAEQCILCRPTPNSPKLEQPFHRGFILQRLDRFQIEPTISNRL